MDTATLGRVALDFLMFAFGYAVSSIIQAWLCRPRVFKINNRFASKAQYEDAKAEHKRGLRDESGKWGG